MTLNDGAGGVKQLAWSPDGRQLAGIHSSGSVIIWNASRGLAYSNSDAFRNRITSQNSDALFAEAEFHQKKNDSDAALRVLDQLLQADTDNVNALRLRGSIFSNLSRCTLAIADYERITEINPQHQVAWNFLGLSQMRLGLFDEAIVSLTAAYDASPKTGDDPRAHRAVAYILRGDVEKGQSELQLISDKEPLSFASSLLAALYISRGEFKSYRDHCKRVSGHIQPEKNPYAIIYTCWMCCLVPNALDDYEGLLSEVKQIQQKHPDSQWCNLNLGAALFRAGKFEQAGEQLKMGASRAGSGADTAYAHYFLAFTQHALGQKDRAHESLAKARSLAKEKYVNGIPPEWYTQQKMEILESEAMSLLPAQSNIGLR